VKDEPWEGVPKPITQASLKLLKEYSRRREFWFFCARYGATKEWAGAEFLKVKKTRAHEIYDEMDDIGGPLGWFREAYSIGIKRKTMLRGRETQKSTLADVFFCALDSGCVDVLKRLEESAGNKTVDLVSVLRGKEEYEAEVIRYAICSLTEQKSTK
jgi:hypothetical protein